MWDRKLERTEQYFKKKKQTKKEKPKLDIKLTKKSKRKESFKND